MVAGGMKTRCEADGIVFALSTPMVMATPCLSRGEKFLPSLGGAGMGEPRARGVHRHTPKPVRKARIACPPPAVPLVPFGL